VITYKQKWRLKTVPSNEDNYIPPKPSNQIPPRRPIRFPEARGQSDSIRILQMEDGIWYIRIETGG